MNTKAASVTNATTKKPRKKSVKSVRSADAKTFTTALITPEKRHQMIAETAYYLAEARGFDSNDELGDWLEAEALVDKKLSNTKNA